jgi:purine-binding chemotaxis protein CheW
VSAFLLPRSLVFRSDSKICVLPLGHIVEVLRPLQIQPIADAPLGVEGLSVIRGEAVPVLDLPMLLGGSRGARGRWIVVRAGERRVALAVDAVIGIRELSASAWTELPPLVRDAGAIIDAVAILDEQVLLVLKTGNLVPEAVWESLTRGEA